MARGDKLASCEPIRAASSASSHEACLEVACSASGCEAQVEAPALCDCKPKWHYSEPESAGKGVGQQVCTVARSCQGNDPTHWWLSVHNHSSTDLPVPLQAPKASDLHCFPTTS